MTNHQVMDQREDLHAVKVAAAARPCSHEIARSLLAKLDGAQTDTLIALVERGPLGDGYVPSKRGRDDLIRMGFAVRVLVDGEHKTAAALDAADLYMSMFGGLTLAGAIAARKKQRAAATSLYESEPLR